MARLLPWNLGIKQYSSLQQNFIFDIWFARTKWDRSCFEQQFQKWMMQNSISWERARSTCYCSKRSFNYSIENAFHQRLKALIHGGYTCHFLVRNREMQLLGWNQQRWIQFIPTELTQTLPFGLNLIFPMGTVLSIFSWTDWMKNITVYYKHMVL